MNVNLSVPALTDSDVLSNFSCPLESAAIEAAVDEAPPPPDGVDVVPPGVDAPGVDAGALAADVLLLLELPQAESPTSRMTALTANPATLAMVASPFSRAYASGDVLSAFLPDGARP